MSHQIDPKSTRSALGRVDIQVSGAALIKYADIFYCLRKKTRSLFAREYFIRQLHKKKNLREDNAHDQ